MLCSSSASTGRTLKSGRADVELVMVLSRAVKPNDREHLLRNAAEKSSFLVGERLMCAGIFLPAAHLIPDLWDVQIYIHNIRNSHTIWQHDSAKTPNVLKGSDPGFVSLICLDV